MSRWKPIETAPKDGFLIVVTNAATAEISLAHKTRDGEVGWTQYVNGTPMLFQPKLRFEPTHWMPLPEPPEARS